VELCGGVYSVKRVPEEGLLSVRVHTGRVVRKDVNQDKSSIPTLEDVSKKAELCGNVYSVKRYPEEGLLSARLHVVKDQAGSVVKKNVNQDKSSIPTLEDVSKKVEQCGNVYSVKKFPKNPPKPSLKSSLLDSKRKRVLFAENWRKNLS
jgi:signal recognition particle subunit SEC65